MDYCDPCSRRAVSENRDPISPTRHRLELQSGELEEIAVMVTDGCGSAAGLALNRHHTFNR